jgi:phage terminase large subunit-like protein
VIDTDALLKRNTRTRLIQKDKPDTSARAKVKREGHTSQASSALTNIKVFADLIKFRNGWDNFGECHDELVSFITKPQISKECLENLKYQGDEYAAHLRRLVLMPRGHLKSTLGTILYTLWRIYRNPDIRILVACNLQSLSYSFIREVRSYLENPELKDVWNNRPHIKGALLPALDKRNRQRNMSNMTETEDKKIIWNNVALQVNRRLFAKEPTVFATSVGTTVTGMHFDLVILDDLIDFKNIESELKKAQVEEWIADVESVLDTPKVVNVSEVAEIPLEDTVGSEVLINGTRYAVDDYYAKVIEQQDELGYKCHVRNIYRNGTDASNGYLWHERYTDAIVRSLQARLSPRRFASQYLNTVYEKDTRLFATECIRIIPNDSYYRHADNSYFKHPSGNIEHVYPILAVDPAFSTSKSGDDCAILVGFKLSNGELVVLDCVLDRLEAKTFVAEVKRFSETYGVKRLFVEENGVGKLVPELFSMQTTYVDGKPIICYPHWEQRVKESKIQGVLELPIASGKVAFSERVRSNERIWKQLTNYPSVSHDDFLDGLVTLYEKTIPARHAYNPGLQDITINGIPLLGDKRMEGIQTIINQHQESYLSEYNRFFE